MNTTKQPDALLKTASDRTEIKKNPCTSTALISVLQISDSLSLSSSYTVYLSVTRSQHVICVFAYYRMKPRKAKYTHGVRDKTNLGPNSKNYIVKASILNTNFHSRTTAHMECVNMVLICKFLNKRVWILTFTAFGNKTHLQRKTPREKEHFTMFGTINSFF